METGIPRVLVATPTYEGKNYCLPQFIANVGSKKLAAALITFIGL
jgi:hypothetical protein